MVGKRINVVMQSDVLVAIDDVASRRDVSRSHLVNLAVAAYLAGEYKEECDALLREAMDRELLKKARGAIQEVESFLNSMSRRENPDEYPMH